MDGFADRTPHHLSFSNAASAASECCLSSAVLVLDNRRRTSTLRRRELADIVRSLDVTLLMIITTCSTPLELCPRGRDRRGVIVADGPRRRSMVR
jgi:cobalt/nickel transport system ATP-binding protein